MPNSPGSVFALRSLKPLVAVLCILLLAPSLLLGSEREGTACAMTWKELVEIKQADFSIAHKYPLTGEPLQYFWSSANGDRLAIITQKYFLPRAPGHLLVFDLAEHRLLRKEALDTGGWNILKTEDGTGFVFIHGRPKRERPPSLMRVDGRTGETDARKDLEDYPDQVFVGPGEGVIGLVYFGGRDDEQAAKNGKLKFLDPDTLEVVGQIDFSRPINYSALRLDIDRLHLLDQGVDQAGVGTVPGRLFIVDLKEKKLVTEVDVDTAPGHLSWDPELEAYYLLSRSGSQESATAILRIVGPDSVVRKLSLPENPVALTTSPDRQRLYLLRDKGITVVDGASGDLIGKVALEHQPATLLHLGDSNQAYVLHANSNKVTAVDLGERKILGTFVTGRAGVKVGKAFVFALNLISYGMAVAANASGSYIYTPYVNLGNVNAPSARTPGFLSEDGKHAYLYNTSTDDVTVVDTTKHEVVAKLAGGSRAIRLVFGGKYLVTASGNVRVFDTENHEQLVEFGIGQRALEWEEGGSLLYAWNVKSKVKVIDFERLVVRDLKGAKGQVVLPAQ